MRSSRDRVADYEHTSAQLISGMEEEEHDKHIFPLSRLLFVYNDATRTINSSN